MRLQQYPEIGRANRTIFSASVNWAASRETQRRHIDYRRYARPCQKIIQTPVISRDGPEEGPAAAQVASVAGTVCLSRCVLRFRRGACRYATLRQTWPKIARWLPAPWGARAQRAGGRRCAMPRLARDGVDMLRPSQAKLGAPTPKPSALKPTHRCPISRARPHLVLASRVYGTPSNGFWLAPSLSLTTQITRGCL